MDLPEIVLKCEPEEENEIDPDRISYETDSAAKQFEIVFIEPEPEPEPNPDPENEPIIKEEPLFDILDVFQEPAAPEDTEECQYRSTRSRTIKCKQTTERNGKKLTPGERQRLKRQNETFEEREARLKRRRASVRTYKLNMKLKEEETPELRQIRLQQDRERNRQRKERRRRAETPAEREHRLMRRREYKRKYMENKRKKNESMNRQPTSSNRRNRISKRWSELSEEGKAEYRAKQRARYQTLTPEQHQYLLNRKRFYVQRRLDNETDEERERRQSRIRESIRIRKEKALMMETPQQKELRRQRDRQRCREYDMRRKMTETPDEREARLKRQREYKREYLKNKKMQQQTEVPNDWHPFPSL